MKRETEKNKSDGRNIESVPVYFNGMYFFGELIPPIEMQSFKVKKCFYEFLLTFVQHFFTLFS